MLETLMRMDINMLFCIGGDGTLRAAHDLAMAALKRDLNICVIGIPKTIDNDICYIDKTFGFETAVYATNPMITVAHNEAKGAPNGVGLIHVMGRDSGFIAAYSSLANPHINYCLVPEVKFTLEGEPDSFFPILHDRLKRRHHAVIIVAEGAGQELMKGERQVDKSGNLLNNNIGVFIREDEGIFQEAEFRDQYQVFRSDLSDPRHSRERNGCGVLPSSRPERGPCGDGGQDRPADRALERCFHACAD